MKKVRSFFRALGPGLVTGASDDDPSGIATYSQAGAQFGFATLWTAWLTFPLMAAIQGMCARIGLVTTQGLTVTLKRHYPRWVLYTMLLFGLPAITLNIGADIHGMGAVAHMVIPQIPVNVFCILFTALLMVVIIRYPYQRIALILKWLCIFLLTYIFIPFIMDVDWRNILKQTFSPGIHLTREYISILVAILGTTISPYLFFWQATMEAEDLSHSGAHIVVDKTVLRTMRKDVNFGMLLSNVVMYFIILTAGCVLYDHGVRDIETIEQAAAAMQPLSGKLAGTLFTISIIGTGMLAIPVLAGSQAYMLAETFGWDAGLDRKFPQAKPFYLCIVVSLIIGLLFDFLDVSPVKALYYTAILYGITAPPLILIILHIANNRKVMKENTNSRLSNFLGFLTLVLMTAAAVTMFLV